LEPVTLRDVLLVAQRLEADGALFDGGAGNGGGDEQASSDGKGDGTAHAYLLQRKTRPAAGGWRRTFSLECGGATPRWMVFLPPQSKGVWSHRTPKKARPHRVVRNSLLLRGQRDADDFLVVAGEAALVGEGRVRPDDRTPRHGVGRLQDVGRPAEL